jgi:hypothetical protein
MAEDADLTTWMDRVSRCTTRKQVFAVLDDFRLQGWSDEECAQMGKHYIRFLSNMKDETPLNEKPLAEEAKGEDGPVWYEKM